MRTNPAGHTLVVWPRDEFARPAAGFGEPLRPAGNPEYRQGGSDQSTEQPGRSASAEHIGPVGCQRGLLLRRVAADVDPVRDRGLRHPVPEHLAETMSGHQPKQEQQPGQAGYQLVYFGAKSRERRCGSGVPDIATKARLACRCSSRRARAGWGGQPRR
jgi:hypothetical protein